MNFTDLQRSILDGCLLGDGSLIINKNGKNAHFQYLSSVKEHVEVVWQHFKILCNESFQEEVKRREYYDKRTNKTYVQYYFITKSLDIFTKEYYRWYQLNKIVPDDVILDNISILFWYLGDGELESSNGYIKLHTNSFSKEDNEKLCLKLGFESKLQKKKEGVYLITIPHKNTNNFLEYIGDCPVEKYLHKWRQVPYINKNIELNGVNNYSNLYESILNDWYTNNFTVYGLSKKYKIPHKCIYNYFEKNDIERFNIENKKKIFQYDLNGNFIKEWESGQEIKRILGYNSSAISECCRGKRNTYKKCKWEFKNN